MAMSNPTNDGRRCPISTGPVLDRVFRRSASLAGGLREAGPLVYLDKWNVYGVARYAEVHAVLNDPATFCSSRGVGLSDFSRRSHGGRQASSLKPIRRAHAARVRC